MCVLDREQLQDWIITLGLVESKMSGLLQNDDSENLQQMRQHFKLCLGKLAEKKVS